MIIGNEILSGKVEEKNAAFFAERFRALGIRLSEIAVVEDRVDAIAEAVGRLAARHDVVCTSGGIGPTHDDVTIEAVARCFGVAVVESEELVAAMTGLLAERLLPGHRRMARVPEGAVLRFGGKIPWPTMQMRNVFVFPGVPWLLRAKFADLEASLGASAPMRVVAFRLDAEEATICEALDAVVARHPGVEIGSYPWWDGSRWRLRLTAEAVSSDAVRAAADDLRVTFAAFIEGEDLDGSTAP